MAKRALLIGVVLLVAYLLSALTAGAAQAKDEGLTFARIVITSGGQLTRPVEITDASDLAGSALDSIRPSVPPQEDLGTAYRLVLYPKGSDATIEVTYYASRRGDRGYIHQAQAVLLDPATSGTLGPGWSRPTQALEATLRKYGVVDVPLAEGLPATGKGPDDTAQIWHQVSSKLASLWVFLLAVTMLAFALGAWMARATRVAR